MAANRRWGLAMIVSVWLPEQDRKILLWSLDEVLHRVRGGWARCPEGTFDREGGRSLAEGKAIDAALVDSWRVARGERPVCPVGDRGPALEPAPLRPRLERAGADDDSGWVLRVDALDLAYLRYCTGAFLEYATDELLRVEFGFSREQVQRLMARLSTVVWRRA